MYQPKRIRDMRGNMMLLVAVGICVVLIVGGIVVYKSTIKSPPETPATTINPPVKSVTQTTYAISPPATEVENDPGLTALDTNLASLDGDSSNVDAGLNDKQIDLSE